MDQNSQTYRLRMQGLENTLAEHRDRFERFDARNDRQSAQIRSLERQLYDLKFDNTRLNEQVSTLRSNDYTDQQRRGQNVDAYNREYDRNRDATNNTDRYSKPEESHYYKDHLHVRQSDFPDGIPVYMLIRTKKDNYEDLKKTFQRHYGTLGQSGGRLKGFVYSDTIKVDNGNSNWYLSKALSDGEYGCDNVMALLTFPSATEAKTWITYHPDFKKAQFPEPDGAEILLLPIRMSVGDAPFTIVLMEYSNVTDQEYFGKHVIDPMIDILRKDYKSEYSVPFISYVERAGDKHSIRGWWLGRNKTIVAHSFYNDQEAKRFCNDSGIETLRRKAASASVIPGYGYETRVRFTVEPFRPEKRK